jgi:hypothetical protein
VMDQACFRDGVSEMVKFTGAAYHPKALQSLWEEVKELPNEAMARAFTRLIRGHNEGCRVAMQVLAHLIVSEGKALREEQGRLREAAWDLEKQAEAAAVRNIPPAIKVKLQEILGCW